MYYHFINPLTLPRIIDFFHHQDDSLALLAKDLTYHWRHYLLDPPDHAKFSVKDYLLERELKFILNEAKTIYTQLDKSTQQKLFAYVNSSTPN